MSSQITNQVYESIKEIAGHKVAIRGLLKVETILSAKLDFPRLFFIDCAPSGHLKTWTSEKASLFFPKSWTLPLRSDFTIHRLFEKTKGNVNKKCLMVNDATLLFSSKSEKTKQRLVNGLAELMTDKEYEYGDFQRCFIIKGQISTIFNLTTKSYNRNSENLLGNTFDERCLTLHSELSQKEFDAIDFSTNRPNSNDIIDISSISGRKVDVTIPEKFEKDIRLYASEYSWRSVKGYPRTQATVRAILRANAFLNDRTEVCKNDFWIVEQAKQFLINPLQPNKPRIIQLLTKQSKHSRYLQTA